MKRMMFLKNKFPDLDFASQYLRSIVTAAFHLTLAMVLKFFHLYYSLKTFHLALVMFASINLSLFNI